MTRLWIQIPMDPHSFFLLDELIHCSHRTAYTNQTICWDPIETERSVATIPRRSRGDAKRKTPRVTAWSLWPVVQSILVTPPPNVPCTNPPKPHFSPYVPNRFTEPYRKSRFQPTFCPKSHFRSELSKILWIRPLDKLSTKIVCQEERRGECSINILHGKATSMRWSVWIKLYVIASFFVDLFSQSKTSKILSTLHFTNYPANISRN